MGKTFDFFYDTTQIISLIDFLGNFNETSERTKQMFRHINN